MPDRCANGDPGNHDLPGFPDQVRRADVGAGRHGGDIAGIVAGLDYIASMGYTMLWPAPLTENNQPQYSHTKGVDVITDKSFDLSETLVVSARSVLVLELK